MLCVTHFVPKFLSESDHLVVNSHCVGVAQFLYKVHGRRWLASKTDEIIDDVAVGDAKQVMQTVADVPRQLHCLLHLRIQQQRHHLYLLLLSVFHLPLTLSLQA